MEKQGIITGTGNKITPQIDAVINDFILGYNTILNGLEMNGNNLSAGSCVLLGYCGVISTGLNNITENYVYGKFIINFDDNIVDEFSIITSNLVYSAPTSITSAGTYYLPLYHKSGGQWQAMVERYGYPYQSEIANNSENLIAGGTISETAETETASINDNSNRVANTEYVHNQIEEELDEGVSTISIASEYYSQTTNQIKKRAKYVIMKLSFTATRTVHPLDFTVGEVIGTVPSGYQPSTAKFVIAYGESLIGMVGSVYKLRLKIYGSQITIDSITKNNVGETLWDEGIKFIMEGAGYEID